jgi:hypothetical protein
MLILYMYLRRDCCILHFGGLGLTTSAPLSFVPRQVQITRWKENPKITGRSAFSRANNWQLAQNSSRTSIISRSSCCVVAVLIVAYSTSQWAFCSFDDDLNRYLQYIELYHLCNNSKIFFSNSKFISLLLIIFLSEIETQQQ